MGRFKRIFSCLVAFVFFVNDISFNFADATAGKAVSSNQNSSQLPSVPRSNLQISSKFGQITDSFEGKSDEMVIQIQDVHCHFEAQSNVARILDEILKKHEGHNLEVINVEGSSGLLDTSLLTLFPDSKIKKSLALYFLKKGKINGAEFLSIMKDRPLRLNGVENLNLYFENLKWFNRSLKLRADAEETIDNATEILNQLKEKVYNSELKKYLAQKNIYEEGKTDIEAYLNEIQKLSEQKNIKNNDLKNVELFLESSKIGHDIQFDKIEEERVKVIEKLLPKLDKGMQAEFLTKGLYLRLEKITPEEYYQYFHSLLQLAKIEIGSTEKNFKEYMAYLKVFSQIQKGKLFEEMDEWESRLKEKLMQTEEEKSLEKASEYISFLKSFYHLELTRKDLQIYQDTKNTFGPNQLKEILEKETKKYNIQIGKAEKIQQLEKDLASLEAFYKAAIARDEVLVENTLKSLNEGQQTTNKDFKGVTQNEPHTTVLLAGGFHTEGVAQKLKEKGVSYVVITPRVTEVRAKTPYVSVMTDERSELENILAKEMFKNRGSSVAERESKNKEKTLETVNLKSETNHQTTNLKFATSGGQYKVTTVKKRKTIISDSESTKQNSNTALATMSPYQNPVDVTSVADAERKNNPATAAVADRKAEAVALAMAEQVLAAKISVFMLNDSFYRWGNSAGPWEEAIKRFALNQETIRNLLSTLSVTDSIKIGAERLGGKLYLLVSDSTGKEIAGFIVSETVSKEGLLALEGKSVGLREFRREKARASARGSRKLSAPDVSGAPYRTSPFFALSPALSSFGQRSSLGAMVTDLMVVFVLILASCGGNVGVTTPPDADDLTKDASTKDSDVDVDASMDDVIRNPDVMGDAVVSETGIDAGSSETGVDAADVPLTTDTAPIDVPPTEDASVPTDVSPAPTVTATAWDMASESPHCLQGFGTTVPTVSGTAPGALRFYQPPISFTPAPTTPAQVRARWNSWRPSMVLTATLPAGTQKDIVIPLTPTARQQLTHLVQQPGQTLVLGVDPQFNSDGTAGLSPLRHFSIYLVAGTRALVYPVDIPSTSPMRVVLSDILPTLNRAGINVGLLSAVVIHIDQATSGVAPEGQISVGVHGIYVPRLPAFVYEAPRDVGTPANTSSLFSYMRTTLVGFSGTRLVSSMYPRLGRNTLRYQGTTSGSSASVRFQAAGGSYDVGIAGPSGTVGPVDPNQMFTIEGLQASSTGTVSGRLILADSTGHQAVLPFQANVPPNTFFDLSVPLYFLAAQAAPFNVGDVWTITYTIDTVPGRPIEGAIDGVIPGSPISLGSTGSSRKTSPERRVIPSERRMAQRDVPGRWRSLRGGISALFLLLVSCIFSGALTGCSSHSDGPIDTDVIVSPEDAQGDASVNPTDVPDKDVPLTDRQTPTDVAPDRDVSTDVRVDVSGSSTFAMSNMGGDAPTVFLNILLLEPVTSGAGTAIGQYEIDAQPMTMEVHQGVGDYPMNDSQWLEMYKRWRRRIIIGGHLGTDGSIEIPMSINNTIARQAIAAHIAAGRNFVFGLDALWDSRVPSTEPITGAMLVFYDTAGREIKTINATESDGRRSDFGKILFPASELAGIDTNIIGGVKFVLRRSHVGSNGDFSIALDPGFYPLPYYATSDRAGTISPFTITTLDRDIPGQRPNYYPVTRSPNFASGLAPGSMTVLTDGAMFRRDGNPTVVARAQLLPTTPFTPTINFPSMSSSTPFDLVTSENLNGLVHVAVMAPQASFGRPSMKLVFRNLASAVRAYVNVNLAYPGVDGNSPSEGGRAATYRYFAFPADAIVRRGSAPRDTGVNSAAVSEINMQFDFSGATSSDLVVGVDGFLRLGPTALGRKGTRKQSQVAALEGSKKVAASPTVVGKGKIENGSYAGESGIGKTHQKRIQLALARAVKENSELANVSMPIELYSDLNTDAEVHSNHVRFRAGAFDDDGLAAPWQEGTVDFMLAFKIRHELTAHDTPLGEILPMMGDLRFFYNATLEEKTEFIRRAGTDPYARFILENYNKSFEEQLTAVIELILAEESLSEEERIYPPDQIAKAKQFQKLRTEHAQVTKLQEKLSPYQVHATAAEEVQMIGKFLESGEVLSPPDGQKASGEGQRIVNALSSVIPVFAQPIRGEQIDSLFETALGQLTSDVVMDNGALAKAIREAKNLISTQNVTLDQLNEKVAAVVKERVAQERSVAVKSRDMHKGILVAMLLWANLRRGNDKSPVAIYKLVESEYLREFERPDTARGAQTLEGLLAILPEIGKDESVAELPYRKLKGRDNYLGTLLRDLSSYFSYLAKLSKKTENGLGELTKELSRYDVSDKAFNLELKNLLLQTQARVIEITAEGAIKIGSETLVVEGASEKLAALYKSGVTYIDMISQGIVSPDRFAIILNELLARSSPLTDQEEMTITGFSDEHAVRVKREENTLRVSVIPEINFLQRYHQRVGAMQTQHRERPESQTQVWGGETLRLKIARDASDHPIREDGKVKVTADAQNFAELYRAFGSLKNSTGVFAVNVVISFVLEEGINAEEVDTDAVLKAVLGEEGYTQAKANKNVKVLLHPHGSQNLAQGILSQVAASFYKGSTPDAKTVAFILSEAEAKNYGDLSGLIHTLLTGSLDAKSAYLLAEQLAAGGVLDESSEVYQLLRKADPETLAALKEGKTPSLKDSMESLELGVRSYNAASIMA